MLRVRPVAVADHAALYKLAQQAGVGFTSLPADKHAIQRKIAMSLASFNGDAQQAYFLLVIEDMIKKRVVGCSAIDAKVGGAWPFYAYKLSTKMQVSQTLTINQPIQILTLNNDYQDCTELCSLFLAQNYRHSFNARLLSYARLLLIAQFPALFSEKVIVELRGVSDEAGNSPFWESVGRHFFFMDFATADRLTMTQGKQFIVDLVPHHPIYVSMLTLAAQAAIGQPHKDTIAAKILLERQGFTFGNYVDIFDAGPLMEVARQKIKIIKHYLQVELAEITELDNSATELYLISNTQLHMLATVAPLYFRNDSQICITPQTADILQVTLGAPLGIAPLN
ncbi:MAG: arginine N-succinyltransferase [Gammaproteobacteria bacterium]